MTQTAKYTPGPWITFKLDDGRIAVNSPSEEQHICQTVYEGAEHEANAKLIAAAPDMARLLADILSNLDGGNPIRSGSRIFEEDEPTQNVIRATLEKAGVV